MKKKLRLLWIPVGIGLLILLIHECTKTKPVFGKRFEMTCTKVNNEADIGSLVKSAVLYFDNSGSMKGYTELVGPDAEKRIVATTTEGLVNLEAAGVESIRVECGNSVINSIDEYRVKLRDGKLLNGATTELGDMFKKATKQVSDTSVSIMVTDMVLSFGREKVKNNHWLNKMNLWDLGVDIYHTVLRAKNEKKAHFIVLQYLSDFNGKYYCNCTEKFVMPENNPRYYDSLMSNRPYYIVVIGGEQALKSIIVNQCFKDYCNIYTTLGLDNSDMMTQPFNAKREVGPWALGTDKNKNGCLVATTNKDEARFEISFAPFIIPKYVNSDYHVGNYSSNIKGVEENGKTSYTVSLYPCKTKYKTEKDLEQAWFVLESANGTYWSQNSSINDDVNIKGLKDLEGKTWGLNAVIENIDKAYFPQGRPKDQVAKIGFNIVYHN